MSDSPILSLLHTTARLPDGWLRAYQEWFRLADHPENCEYILTVDTQQQWEEVLPVFRSNVKPEHRGLCNFHTERPSAVSGWNYAAVYSEGKILVTVADDWFPPEHWDTDLIEAIPNLDAEHVVAVDNQDNSNMLAFSILTKAYYDRYGYIFHPDYDGLMADQEFTEQVARDGVLVGAKYMKFRHLNPERGDAPWDEIYQKHRGGEALATGQKIYLLRKQRGFPKERLIQWVDNVPMPIDKISKSVVG